MKYLQQYKRGKETQSLVAVDLELSVVLRRLKLQILSFLALYPMCDHPLIGVEDEVVTEEVPDRFATLNEAFTSSTSLATRVLQHVGRSGRCRDATGPRDGLIRQQNSLSRSVDQWNKVYEPIFLELCRNFTMNVASIEHVGALLLQTGILAFEIMISTSMSKKEIVFDNFIERFRQVTVLSRLVLRRTNNFGFRVA